MAGTVTEVPLSVVGSQGNAAGVWIDGVVYPLANEPPPAKPGNWWRKISN